MLLVLVLCMLALTFAWFSSNQNNETTVTLEAGTYIKVEFDDSGSLNSEKFNGQKGYSDDGTPYTDDDRAYEAYYHTAVRLQGDRNLFLRMEFSGLTIKVSETFYIKSAKATVRDIISLFEGYDSGKSHIGKAETVTTENGGELLLTDPSDGSEPFVYTDDGTDEGNVVCIRLNKANVDKFFTLEYAKIASTNPNVYGDFSASGEGLEFSYGPKFPAGVSEVTSDAAYGKVNPVCVKITYSNAGYAMTFPFSDDSFKGAEFAFEVRASANYS